MQLVQRLWISKHPVSLCRLLPGSLFNRRHHITSQNSYRKRELQRKYKTSSRSMASRAQGKKLVVLDVDAGQDDAQAIMLALTRPNVQVLGITCVAGNVDVDQVCQNVLRVLKVYRRLGVPVYKGASVPLLGPHIDARFYHGMDGLGDVPDPDPPKEGVVQPEHAVNALLRLSKQYPGEISLVAVAPLTNLALAVRMDPEFPARLKELVLMGGNINGIGNVTPSGEFNFYCDPEAAHIVLDSYKVVPISTVPWEPCIGALAIPWDKWDKIMAIPTERGKFHAAIHAEMVRTLKVAKDFGDQYHTCDPFALMVATNPEVVLESEKVYATVELHGQATRGQMVCDYRGKWGKEPNLRIIKKIDMKAALQMFKDALQ